MTLNIIIMLLSRKKNLNFSPNNLIHIHPSLSHWTASIFASSHLQIDIQVQATHLFCLDYCNKLLIGLWALILGPLQFTLCIKPERLFSNISQVESLPCAQPIKT